MIKTRNRVFTIIGILLLSFAAEAQNADSNPLYLAFKPHYGFIIPHSPEIKDVSHTNPYGFDLEMGWSLLQEKDWKRCNCYSRAGFSFMHMDFNYPDVLGDSHNIIGFVEPYLNYHGFVLTSVRMGAGLSYLTKVYDEQTNPENKFFSSPLSFLVHVDVNAMKYLSDHWFLNAYIKYNHISNGGNAKPNKGMNFPTIGFGAGYSFDPVHFQEQNKVRKDTEDSLRFIARLFGTREPTGKNDKFGDKKLSMGVLLQGQKPVSRINAISAGVESVADFKKEIKNQSVTTEYRQISALAGHSFVFGKFDFSQYWGTYLYAPAYENKNFFQRYSLSYEVFENFSFGVTLKAHGHVAENFNLLLGYTFREL